VRLIGELLRHYCCWLCRRVCTRRTDRVLVASGLWPASRSADAGVSHCWDSNTPFHGAWQAGHGHPLKLGIRGGWGGSSLLPSEPHSPRTPPILVALPRSCVACHPLNCCTVLPLSLPHLTHGSECFGRYRNCARPSDYGDNGWWTVVAGTLFFLRLAAHGCWSWCDLMSG
jgi:hypothetical protein